MERRHHFHLDRRGHSVTVNTRTGKACDIEVLVDGKEIAHQKVRDRGTIMLDGELPDDPPTPFRIRLRQARFGSLAPYCVLEVEGANLRMPERLYV